MNLLTTWDWLVVAGCFVICAVAILFIFFLMSLLEEKKRSKIEDGYLVHRRMPPIHHHSDVFYDRIQARVDELRPVIPKRVPTLIVRKTEKRTYRFFLDDPQTPF